MPEQSDKDLVFKSRELMRELRRLADIDVERVRVLHSAADMIADLTYRVVSPLKTEHDNQTASTSPEDSTGRA